MNMRHTAFRNNINRIHCVREQANMSKRLQGGCQCGAIRYETAAAPVLTIHCYCRQCQRVTGRGALVASRFACERGPGEGHVDPL